MLGYDTAMRFLTSKDEEERSRMQVLAAGAREVQRQHDLERATQTANAVGKMFG